MSQAKTLFDQAVNLKPGHSIAVECPSEGQMNSLRTLLYRERTAFIEAVGPEFNIKISGIKSEDKFFVIAKKEPPLMPPIILDEEGNIVSKLEFERDTPQPAPDVPDVPDDTERMKQLMRNDGVSEEEIAAYFGEDDIPDLSEENS